ncbi:hypothetical protein I8752_33675 [Nostocaceae cyanobacterium CENA369]|uniref:Uncharacterized protein n=1 Tax=Dendronalium phyllosphericum CENA369 TaxID=1725256 RepID=A0A8J7LI23_9NOST|nr:hypothetical protein [Dendronalium phyllosphericum]MBH8577826.1 hypothetical protein [Dendronalium phyllosphericum CENA369]
MNLEPYNLVSNQPSISRDMSIVTGIDTDIEDICEQIVRVLGNDAKLLESVAILSERKYHQLLDKGIQSYQKNLLELVTGSNLPR